MDERQKMMYVAYNWGNTQNSLISECGLLNPKEIQNAIMWHQIGLLQAGTNSFYHLSEDPKKDGSLISFLFNL